MTMALQPVRPQLQQSCAAHDSASDQGDSADCLCFDGDGDDDDDDDDAVSDPGLSSASNQCSLAGDLDIDDAWLTPRDRMALLKILGPQQPALRPCGSLPPIPQHRLRRLPTGAVPVRLIGEGSANAVFEFNVPRLSCSGADFDGMLLRVAKVPSRSDPPTYNYLAQQDFYQSSIKPLLGNHAVQQELVVLHKSGIVDELNKFLASIDSSRKPKFRGSFIGQTDWGFLVQDMRPQDADDWLLIEFKPKWLSQSPSAPKDAIRCRQCAMELRNLIKDPSADRVLPEQKPCPLALVNQNAPPQVGSPFRIAPQLADAGRDDHFREALRSIADHPAIHQLKDEQNRHDSLGPLYAEPSDCRFIIAMTLRDCTCFARIHRRQQSVEIRLGDFDRKDPRVKFDRWRRAEEELIDGGFYTAEWILCDGSYYRPPTLCALEFSSAGRRRHPEVLNIQDRDGLKENGRDAANAQMETAMKSFNHEADVAALQQLLGRFKVASTARDHLSGHSGATWDLGS